MQNNIKYTLDILLPLLAITTSHDILLKDQLTACKVQLANSKARFADPNNSKVQLEKWQKSYVCALNLVSEIQKWPQNPVYCNNILKKILEELVIDAKAMKVIFVEFKDITISDIDRNDQKYLVTSEYTDQPSSDFDSTISMLESVVTHINGQSLE